jgi:hypothetical protein
MGIISTIAAIVALAAALGAGTPKRGTGIDRGVGAQRASRHRAAGDGLGRSRRRGARVRRNRGVLPARRRPGVGRGRRLRGGAAPVRAGALDDAFALLERSEGHEIASARLAQRQHIRAFVLERRAMRPARGDRSPRSADA